MTNDRKGNALTHHLPAALRPGLRILERLRAEGWETYLVGGVVRDLLIERTPADLDIVTAASPDAVASLFERTAPVGAEFGVVAVVVEGHPYQVATYRTEGSYHDGRHPATVGPADLSADVRRRDFTINALAYDPAQDLVVDLVGGRDDLRRRIIRTVGDPAVRFGEDRLRMLRAVRLAAELEFTIDEAALTAITAGAAGIRMVSAERIHEELARLLVAPGRGEGVRLLWRTGLLGILLPEVQALAGVPGDGPADDRLDQTIRALDALRRPSVALAVAVLLHLVAEPGAPESVCRRLRFSGAERRAVGALVREQARPAGLPAMRASAVRGLLRHLPPAEWLELYRVRAVACGRGGAGYARAAEVLAARFGADGGPRSLLTGRDLLALGYTPGPALAQILESVDAAQARGEIRSRSEARTWVLARFAAGGASRAVEISRGFGQA